MFLLKPPARWFPEACQQANVLNFTWYCFRHTFASGLVMAGVDLRTVQELDEPQEHLDHDAVCTLTPGHQVAAVELLGGPN